MTQPTARGSGDRFEVSTPEVRSSGSALAEAARAVARIRPHDDLEGVMEGLPGSRSADAAAALAAVWQESFGNWTHASDLHATALQQAADDYDTVDARVVDALDDRDPQWPAPKHLHRPGESR